MTQRLIEVAFPLRQASLDSLHEKSVRHGHLSTLHIWPARRPLAASRAAILATLLPAPATAAEREQLLARIGGQVLLVPDKKILNGKEIFIDRWQTVGGILHWGREAGPEVEYFRKLIRQVYNGRMPRLLDPFAGGGAIPLEAIRLGCDATAADINPVAWLLLRCTLEFPNRFANRKFCLPNFILSDRRFMAEFLQAEGLGGKLLESQLERLGLGAAVAAGFDFPGSAPAIEAGLAWQVRAWGEWVLARVRRDLARFYPVIDGEAPAAYLWARTVSCRNCRAQIPLLKTCWLCKKEGKRILLTLRPNADKSGVEFAVEYNPPAPKGNAAARREAEKRRGAGTMSRSGARCPCCNLNSMSMEQIRLEGQAGRLGAVMTAVVVEKNSSNQAQRGKKAKGEKFYRLPVKEEIAAAAAAAGELAKLYAEIPFGIPEEKLPTKEALGFRVPLYGLTRWRDLFTPRQLLAIGIFIKHTRAVRDELAAAPDLAETVSCYLAITLDRLVDRSSTLTSLDVGRQNIRNTFSRFALPIIWDYAEVSPFSELSGGYPGALEWVAGFLYRNATGFAGQPKAILGSAIKQIGEDQSYDLIVTDPPYYDAIPYSDLMDFFYVWLRRTLHGLSPEYDAAFATPLGPKWDASANDGELIDDSSRFEGNAERSKRNYEDGMARAFAACQRRLAPEGRMVVVFANKQAAAWETLAAALIRSGLVVDASWPIQTELANRVRAMASAALASSVWLVCRRRPPDAKPGWDQQVLEEMQRNIETKLREYWDAGIRGPDFLWAATGPALEAYSRHPVVKKVSEAGAVLAVGEFLRAARRMVVNFVVGSVLQGAGMNEGGNLDDITAYYLLHRDSFGFEPAPAGACILYAVSCNISDGELVRREILAKAKAKAIESEDEEGAEEDEHAATAAGFRLRSWQEREAAHLGEDQEDELRSRPAPLIDRIHRLERLWVAGDETAVEEFVVAQNLRRLPMLPRVLQALIELTDPKDSERARLEAIANHLQSRGAMLPDQKVLYRSPSNA